MSTQVIDHKSDIKNFSPWTSIFLEILEKIEYGELTLVTPEGVSLCFKGERLGSNSKVIVNNWKFCEKIFMSGDIGLGESYIDGDWDGPDINSLIRFGIENKNVLERVIKGSLLKIVFYRLKHLFNRNTKAGSKRNIHAHYDLGNDFYRLWLDKSMTYSSAYFVEGTESLYDAQINKYEKIFNELNITEGQHILEVGCGWGGFMEYAASRGVQVTGVTISKEQYEYAKHRLKSISDANVLYCDYRELTGVYDHVVSIEMFEALGYEYWKTYFKKLSTLLRPDGKIIIQSITINDDDFKSYRKGTDFIQQYIFPGGLLSASKEVTRLARKCDLDVITEFKFGKDYGKTLEIWEESFSQKYHDIKNMGFDDKFVRTWRFYLKYCQGGFESGKIGVSHFILSKR